MPFVLENSVKFMYNRITFFALVIYLKEEMYIMKKLLHSIEGICQVVIIKICICKKKLLHTIGRICRMVKDEKWNLIFTILFFLLGFSCVLPSFQDLSTLKLLLLVAGILSVSYGIAIIVWLVLKALGAYLEKY